MDEKTVYLQHRPTDDLVMVAVVVEVVFEKQRVENELA